MSPIAIAFAIVLVVAVVGALLHSMKTRQTYAGYEELKADAAVLARRLKGEIFRDGDDLVVSGNSGKLPTVIRFSRQENTPGVMVRMEAPASFTLSVVPKGARATEGRVVVRTPDEMFDARFTTRSDHPTQARMFVGGKPVITHLQRLMCGSGTFLTVSTGAMELSELSIPGPFTARHLENHIDSLAVLARQLEDMPGAEKVKVAAIKGERKWVTRTAVAVGAIAAIAAVVSATYNPPGSEPAEVQAAQGSLPEGVLPADAPQMAGIYERRQDGTARWRLAGEDDFDPAGRSWLRGNRETVSGRVEGDFSGTGGPRDAGYVLVDQNDNTRRVILLAQGFNVYDATYPQVAIAARVPKGILSTIVWVGGPPDNPDGDGLLIVRERDNPASGVVLFVKDRRIISAVPENWQNLRLR
ncbi:MAG TPA: hypothetical protein VNK82_13480 [Terriglobales bacterium]|nr:hypothetical protein [Terriglobales bacterium]